MANQGAVGVVGQRTAWLLLAAVVFFWGVNWPVMKYGLHYLYMKWLFHHGTEGERSRCHA